MKCPEGQYYCFDDEKCKPIPKGKKVRKDGELVSEVAPPGYGHTKGDKEKGVKKGGTAAAFKRALDDGRFKGLPGSKTKKEKTADMFKLMWSMKKKGAKPHYKPGTDKKYEKYQEESFEIDKSAHKSVQKKAKLRNLAKGNTNPNEKAAAEKKAGGPKLMGEEPERTSEYKAMQASLHPRGDAESASSHRVYGWKKRPLQKNLKAKRNRGYRKPAGARVHEMKISKIKDGKSGAEKIIDAMVSAAKRDREARANRREKKRPKAPYQMLAQEYIPEKSTMKDNNLFGNAYAGSYEDLKKKVGSKKKHDNPAVEENRIVDAMVSAVKGKKKEKKKPEKAMDAGARAKRQLARKVHAKYVSGSTENVPDDIRDHKTWSDFRNELNESKKKGLWDNIHAKRKRGEKPAKPGDKDYPKTLNVEGAAWTKKSGKSPSGGLNEKGRKSYEAENPGSDLKAPSKKPGNKRRASFCARMKGMKKKLTSAKTASDPDSRINKSLRAWNC